MSLYNIVILDCNYQIPSLLKEHGTHGNIYHRYIQKLTADDSRQINIDIFVTIDQQLPKDHNDYHAVIITGSKFSTYEDLPWIQPLEEFIQRCYQAEIKLFGACFGHQIIAQALGGKVKKAINGWGLGITQSDITQQEPWMQPYQESLELAHVHQDQVIKVPPAANIYSSSQHCAIEGFYIGNKVLTHQGHPEFSTDFLEQLLDVKQSEYHFSNTVYKSAKNSLCKNNNGIIFGQWLYNFLIDSAKQ